VVYCFSELFISIFWKHFVLNCTLVFLFCCTLLIRSIQTMARRCFERLLPAQIKMFLLWLINFIIINTVWHEKQKTKRAKKTHTRMGQNTCVGARRLVCSARRTASVTVLTCGRAYYRLFYFVRLPCFFLFLVFVLLCIPALAYYHCAWPFRNAVRTYFDFAFPPIRWYPHKRISVHAFLRRCV